MYHQRVTLYRDLEKKLQSKVLVYTTSDRRGYESQIAQDVIDIFIDQLDKIGIVPKISLFLYTRGGDTAAAWNIVNLLRQYGDDLQVVVPHKAHSGGTLISIGANSIIMTKQATLGPIDPSINTALNPQIPGAMPQNTFPVSVEAVKGYMAFAKEELGIKDDIALSNIMMKLSDTVHPLVLGQVYRTRAQIKMLAEKLLKNQISDADKIKNIISFLCSDSGSHDYTINRREAKKTLGLNVLIPDDEMYRIIKAIYDDISNEMGFGQPFDLKLLSQTNDGVYNIKRALVESIDGGSHYFLTEGKVSILPGPPTAMIPGLPDGFMPGLPTGQTIIQDNRTFEGWKYDEPSTVTPQ
jgi:hypothetical protein